MYASQKESQNVRLGLGCNGAIALWDRRNTLIIAEQ